MTEWRQKSNSSAYESRYKSIDSEEDTRNPTTHKKIHGTPLQFRRSNPYLSAQHPPLSAQHHHSKDFRSFTEELNLLEARKVQCMRLGRIRQAEALQQRIVRTRSASQQQRRQELAEEQAKMKRAVSVAHKTQMHHLHRLWQEYFQTLRQREIHILELFQADRKQQVRAARQILQKRCASLRSHSRQKADLQREQEQCINECRFKELRVVRKQLKSLEQRQQQEHRRQALRWAELEEQRLRTTQSIKYSALMARLQEFRQDREKIYAREQKRLRQKYKNVLAQLHHDQALEISSLNRMLSFDH